MKNQIKYLTKVEISGLWGQHDLVWNLNKDVNVLAGINGSGKSTILNYICSLILSGRIESHQLGLVNKVKLSFNNANPMSYECTQIKESIPELKQKAADGDKFSKQFLSDISDKNEKIPEEVKGVEYVQQTASFSELTHEEFNDIININIISTFDSSLKPSDAVQKLSDDTVKTELDWEVYQLQKKYLDYQLNTSKRKDILTLIPEDASELREKLIKIQAPHKRFLEIINELFLATEKKVNEKENQIAFLLGTDEKELSAYQLSSGEKQLLIILLTVLIQEQEPSILLMDEPEISLHMDWQKKLIGYIRELNPNVQLIIATHSPAMIMNGWLDKVSEMSDLIVSDKEK